MNNKKTKFIFIHPRNCVACWDCIEVCPKRVLGKVQFFWHKHIIIRKADACIGCKRCAGVCTHQAISCISGREKD